MYERLLDKTQKPSEDEFVLYCGKSNGYFAMLDTFLLSESCTRQMRFPYGNSYGWSMKYSLKSKLICDVFAENDAFTVMIRLTNKQFDLIYDGLEADTKENIDNKYPCGDGGWIHYRVIDELNLKDIITIIKSKMNKKDL